MPLAVQCPTCTRELTVPDRLLGRKVKCPKCETMFQAGYAPEPVATTPVAPLPRPAPVAPPPAPAEDATLVVCQGCLKQLSLPARLMGKTVKCPKCATMFQAQPPAAYDAAHRAALLAPPAPLAPPPLVSLADDEPAPEPDPEETAPERPLKKKKKQKKQAAAESGFTPYLVGGGIGAALLAILLVWFLWPTVDPEKWPDYGSKEGNFGIKLPAQPEVRQYEVLLPNVGQVTFNILLAQEDLQEYVVAYADVPNVEGSDQALLDKVSHCQLADLYRQKAMMSTRESRATTFRGYPGKEFNMAVRFVGEEEDSTVICRVYVVKKRVYLLFVGSYEELQSDSKAVRGYFDTFDFLADPPDPKGTAPANRGQPDENN